jgi:Cof subfamily protein (haloacid dehalogenase superfamily)
MNSKLIFLDVDGTLTLPGGYEPPESALRAVRRAREIGHKVFLCSGRNYGMIKPLMKFGFDGGIASCGGYVYTGDKVLYDCPMTEKQKGSLLSMLRASGASVSLESRDYSFNDDIALKYLKQERGSHLYSMIKAVWVDLGARPVAEYDGSPIYKMVISCDSTDVLRPAVKELGEDLNFIIHDFSEKDCVFAEVISREFSKGTGVRIITEALGYDIADTIGFGDSSLDVDMIDVVDIGVCMRNGSSYLKEQSDLICPSVEEDGIEWAFRELGLI